MRDEFRKALLAWRSREQYASEQRIVEVKRHPQVLTEYMVKIVMRENLRFEEATSVVEETRHVLTAAQGEPTSEINGHPYPNPMGDLYRFNTIAKNLEVEFWTKREGELSKLIQEVMPDGFLGFSTL